MIEPMKKRCEICGCEMVFLSQLTLNCNYGSIYDMEKLTLYICGYCTDRLHDEIVKVLKQSDSPRGEKEERD